MMIAAGIPLPSLVVNTPLSVAGVPVLIVWGTLIVSLVGNFSAGGADEFAVPVLGNGAGARKTSAAIARIRTTDSVSATRIRFNAYHLLFDLW